MQTRFRAREAEDRQVVDLTNDQEVIDLTKDHEIIDLTGDWQSFGRLGYFVGNTLVPEIVAKFVRDMPYCRNGNCDTNMDGFQG